jgi:hypothetical protein
MKRLIFEVGDKAWLYLGSITVDRHNRIINSGNASPLKKTEQNLHEGKVVAILNLEGWIYPHYVVELQTGIDPILEVRDGFTLSDGRGPIGMWRR